MVFVHDKRSFNTGSGYKSITTITTNRYLVISISMRMYICSKICFIINWTNKSTWKSTKKKKRNEKNLRWTHKVFEGKNIRLNTSNSTANPKMKFYGMHVCIDRYRPGEKKKSLRIDNKWHRINANIKYWLCLSFSVSMWRQKRHHTRFSIARNTQCINKITQLRLKIESESERK